MMQATGNLLNIHKIVKATGAHNFMKAQVRVPSQLNVEAWQEHLSDYYDKQLLPLICNGFHLDFAQTFGNVHPPPQLCHLVSE